MINKIKDIYKKNNDVIIVDENDVRVNIGDCIDMSKYTKNCRVDIKDMLIEYISRYSIDFKNNNIRYRKINKFS